MGVNTQREAEPIRQRIGAELGNRKGGGGGVTGPGETDEENQQLVVTSSSLPEKKSLQVREKRDAFVGRI